MRRLVHKPGRILEARISKGMTVLDLGCEPGFFTIEMAKLVGGTGKVIAADLQQGMLVKVAAKIRGTDLVVLAGLEIIEKPGIWLSCSILLSAGMR